jgi:radical SAM protein with 4Fe4S-binding SPASM domain
MNESDYRLTEMPERTPTEGTFELTVRCNLHCKMCLFRHDDSENARIMEKELTARQWVDMARQVAEAGTLGLLVTGGEPMIRPDFCEIWEGIYRHGFITTLYTNATLVTGKVMETLTKYPPHRIGVTIYGAGPETYKKVCGNADAFEQALTGIRRLRKLPSKMEYRMAVIKDNYDDLDAVEELLQKEFGPNAALTTTRIVTKAVRGGCADVEACRLPAEKNCKLSFDRAVKKIKRVLGDRFDEGYISISYDRPCQESGERKTLSLFGCSAGMKTYTVSWDGFLLGCQIMEAFAREIHGDFLKAWELFPYGVRLPEIGEKCKQCSVAEHCSLCPAFRYAETGTFTEAPPYICADAMEFSRQISNGKHSNFYSLKKANADRKGESL